jgi:uncharacterized membrane protein YgcG
MNAKQKRILKLVLDAVMLILLVLMYKKQVISISFHEIGGLALIGLFIIHLLINAKWIGAVTKHLFSKTISAHVRACFIVDALLLVAFLTVGITGVLISKVVFSLHVSGNFKTLHYFASAVAVILMGVHLGLHADYIFGKLLRKGAKKAGKIILAVVLALIVAFGAYSLFTTSFVSYLAAPIQAASLSSSVPFPTGEPALDGSDNQQRPMDLSELPDAGTDANTAQPSQGDTAFSGDHQFDGESGGHQGATGGGLGEGGNGNGYGGEGSSGGVLSLIAQYASIIVLFAAITYPFTKLSKRRTSKAQLDPLCDDGSLLDEPAVSAQIAETASEANKD